MHIPYWARALAVFGVAAVIAAGCSQPPAPTAPARPAAPVSQQADCDDPQTTQVPTPNGTTPARAEPTLAVNGVVYHVALCSPLEAAHRTPDVVPLMLDEFVYEPDEAGELDSRALNLVMTNYGYYASDTYINRVPPAQQEAYLDLLEDLAYTNSDQNDGFFAAALFAGVYGLHHRNHHKTHKAHLRPHKAGTHKPGYRPRLVAVPPRQGLPTRPGVAPTGPTRPPGAGLAPPTRQRLVPVPEPTRRPTATPAPQRSPGTGTGSGVGGSSGGGNVSKPSPPRTGRR